MPIEPVAFAVVVAGGMNPAIHHPFWYQAKGIITPEDASTAIGRTTSVPGLSQFSGEDWRVLCTPDRWIGASRTQARHQFILDLAVAAFNYLPETPAAAFGLNYEFAGRPKASDSDPQVLDSLSFERRMRLESTTAVYPKEFINLDGPVRLARALRLTITFHTEQDVCLRVNDHYDIVVDDPATTYVFDLGELLRLAIRSRDQVKAHACQVLEAAQ